MNETYRHKGLRRKLADGLRQKGIKDEKVIEAINAVPRHLFMDSGFVNFAYKDQAFPIGEGQTISQPYTVAYQTELLEVQRGDKILEIGTGSGYQAAVLIEMGAKVFSIERKRGLFLRAQSLLPKIGYHPHFFYGDGFKGLPSYSLFDKIIITAGVHEVPTRLLEQLKLDGIMVVPLGKENNQTMTVIKKVSEGEKEITEHGHFIFVPMLKGKS